MAARARSIDWPTTLIAVPLFLVVGVLAGINPKLSIFAALGFIFVLVALTDLTAALVVLIIVVFAEATPLAGSALSATKLTGLLLTFGWLARLATHPTEREAVIFTAHPVFSYVLALFLSWVAVSITWAENASLAMNQATILLLVAVLYVIVFTAVKGRRQAMFVIGGFVAGTSITAAYGLASQPTLDAADTGRLVSTIQDPNFLAATLIAGIILATAGFFAARGNPGFRLAAGAAVVFCLAAFLLTGSRGGIVGLAAALIAAIIFAGPWRGRITLAATLLTIAAVGYYALYAPPQVVDRITSASQGEVSQRDTRITIWTVAWRMAQDNPVVGVGAGNFEERSINYVLEPGTNFRTDRVIDRPGVAHSTYLGPLAELGIVGASLFFSIIGFSLASAVRAAWQFARNEDLVMEALARGLVVSLVGVLAANFFISAEASKILWLLLAMGPALLSVARGADDTVTTQH